MAAKQAHRWNKRENSTAREPRPTRSGLHQPPRGGALFRRGHRRPRSGTHRCGRSELHQRGGWPVAARPHPPRRKLTLRSSTGETAPPRCRLSDPLTRRDSAPPRRLSRPLRIVGARQRGRAAGTPWRGVPDGIRVSFGGASAQARRRNSATPPSPTSISSDNARVQGPAAGAGAGLRGQTAVEVLFAVTRSPSVSAVAVLITTGGIGANDHGGIDERGVGAPVEEGVAHAETSLVARRVGAIPEEAAGGDQGDARRQLIHNGDRAAGGGVADIAHQQPEGGGAVRPAHSAEGQGEIWRYHWCRSVLLEGRA